MPRRIDTIDYEPFQINIPVYYDTKTGLFSCTYANAPFGSESMKVLREQLFEVVREAHQLTWTPILRVTVPNRPYDEESNIALYIQKQRFYVSRYHPSLRYRQVRWDCAPEQRLDACHDFSWDEKDEQGDTFCPPTSKATFDGYSMFLPYTEADWEALEAIRVCFHQAGGLLRKGISAQAGIQATLRQCERVLNLLTNTQ